MSKFIPAQEYCVKVFDGTHDSPKPSLSGYPLITSKNILGGSLNLKDVYNISEFDYISIQKRSSVSKWDILFSMIGSIGETYLEKNDNIPYAIKNVGVFSCNDEYKAKWLYYYLISPYSKSFINNFLAGAVQKFLPLGTLRNFPIIKYDNSNNLLIDLLSNLDSKIELNNKINSELEKIAKTLYDYWFVQFDFPDENGKPYKSSGGKMVWSEELKREIPEGWEVEKVGGCLKKEVGIIKIPTSEILSKGKVPVIDQSTDFIAGYTNNLRAIINTAEPRIIFGDHTRILKLINFNFARGADGTQVMLSNNKKLPQYLFYYQLLQIDLSNYGYARHFKFLKERKILLPNEKIANDFNNLTKKYYNQNNHNIFENQKLAELRDWLLPMLMNGQVSVK